MCNSFFSSDTKFILIIRFLIFFAAVPANFGGVAYSEELETSVPLQEQSWVTLAFDKIPANTVSFSRDALTVKVRSSAGPIVHKLMKTSKVVEIFVKGKVVGAKKIETNAFDEDSVLRFGLVAIGKRTLSGPKKWFAANWIKKLFALAPKGIGLDKIFFFNLTNRDNLVGKSRTHPKSDLIVESAFANIGQDGSFAARKRLERPIETSALWLSVDGDDTQSAFDTVISEIKIKTVE